MAPTTIAKAIQPSRLSRRDFLVTTASIAAATASRRSVAEEFDNQSVAFVLVGDTHYLANKESPGELDPQSAPVNSQLIDMINRLSGTEIATEAGGGRVAALQGVIHAGDLIDSGDKTSPVHEQMQQTEWAGFVSGFGLTGKDGRLKYPIYEVHGNHDGPQGRGVAIDGIVDRNKRRPGIKDVSPNGLHYSWDWGPVHFINLGIVVGQVKESTQRRRYNPLDSLDFLLSDLKANVGDSGRPVVITHHVDIVRYSGPPDPNDPANLSREWNPCDVHGFYQAIQTFNVIAILYGHTHARNVLKWNGTSARTQDGFDLFNVDNSAHFHSDQQALLYFEIKRDALLVREYATTDRWQTANWTPLSWKRAIKATT
jgi:hypothetical protein